MRFDFITCSNDSNVQLEPNEWIAFAAGMIGMLFYASVSWRMFVMSDRWWKLHKKCEEEIYDRFVFRSTFFFSLFDWFTSIRKRIWSINLTLFSPPLKLCKTHDKSINFSLHNLEKSSSASRSHKLLFFVHSTRPSITGEMQESAKKTAPWESVGHVPFH